MIEISISKLNTFQQCPMKYFLQYIKKISVEKGEALIFGIAIHSTLEKFFKDQSKSLLSFFMKVAKEKNITPEMVKRGTKVLEMFDKNFVSKHEIETIYAEKFVNISHENIRLRGVIDWIGKLDGKLTVIDWKTSKGKNKSYNDLLKSDQVPLYNSICKNILNMEVEQAGLVFMSKFGVQEFISAPTYLTWRGIAGLTNYAYEQIEQGRVYKNITKLCGWCDFKSACDKIKL